MSISLLKTLIAIAEEGSFSAAADRIHVSDAAVGQQMKRLEEHFHATLFDRSNRSPVLNQLGKALVPKARGLIHAYETLLDDLTGDAALFGELTVGSVPSAIRGLVPLSIKQLIQNYPDLHISVVPGLSSDLLHLVESGALDVAILSQPTRIGSNLSWQPLVEEALVLVTSTEITENDPLVVLQEQPFIHHTRRGAVGLMVEQYLENNNISVRFSMEMESLESLTSMVFHNLGVSVIPNLCVPDPIFTKLRKIPLPSGSGARTLGLLSRSDCSKVRLVDRFLAEVKQTVLINAPDIH